MSFERVIGDEEEGCTGGRSDDRTADTAVDTGEATARSEAAGGLEAGFECVERVEGEVYGCSCQTTCLMKIGVNSCCKAARGAIKEGKKECSEFRQVDSQCES